MQEGILGGPQGRLPCSVHIHWSCVSGWCRRLGAIALGSLSPVHGFLSCVSTSSSPRLASLQQDGNYQGPVQTVFGCKTDGIASPTSLQPCHWCNCCHPDEDFYRQLPSWQRLLPGEHISSLTNLIRARVLMFLGRKVFFERWKINENIKPWKSKLHVWWGRLIKKNFVCFGKHWSKRGLDFNARHARLCFISLLHKTASKGLLCNWFYLWPLPYFENDLIAYIQSAFLY